MVASTFRASFSLPSITPSAPCGPLSLAVASRKLVSDAASAASCAVSAPMFSTKSRTAATMRGISAEASPSSTLRTALSGNAGSSITPL